MLGDGAHTTEEDGTVSETMTLCTDEQRAEWQALHDRMDVLYKAKARAQDMALHYLADHVEAGAMAPGPFGVPSAESLDAYRRACELVQEATAAWAEWEQVHEESKAHPYTLEVKARA
jgi:hypothetical protein